MKINWENKIITRKQYKLQLQHTNFQLQTTEKTIFALFWNYKTASFITMYMLSKIGKEKKSNNIKKFVQVIILFSAAVTFHSCQLLSLFNF